MHKDAAHLLDAEGLVVVSRGSSILHIERTTKKCYTSTFCESAAQRAQEIGQPCESKLLSHRFYMR